MSREGHGDLVIVHHGGAEGLDEVALAYSRQVVTGWLGTDAVQGLERARDIVHAAEQAHENDEPFPMVTAWREFPFSMALGLLDKRPGSYEVLAHSRSAARLYAFRAAAAPLRGTREDAAARTGDGTREVDLEMLRR
jgi:hypothetical protein